MRQLEKIVKRPLHRPSWGLRKRGTGFSLSSHLAWPGRLAINLWRGLREWCGDAAYERYLRSKGANSGSCRRLTAEEFYVEQLNRKYSRPNRCC
ncbi:MAG TPA: CstA-like transporter-associated (seleno)protein [Candidatus Acidoferrum sp.]|jgi:uncharacterized short protein YbdD (DUF466 family)|nr:CstA-like transporter-associated (seleno)protein [Candidatus Acidoferrum sp.]